MAGFLSSEWLVAVITAAMLAADLAGLVEIPMYVLILPAVAHIVLCGLAWIGITVWEALEERSYYQYVLDWMRRQNRRSK